MRILKKPAIYTERLILKPYSDKDRERLVEFMTNQEISKTFMVPDYSSPEQYYELADKLIRFSGIEDEKHLEYGIYLNGTMIGFVNDCGYDEEEMEIGYVIHPDYQNHGYASEAVKAVISELWEMGFSKVSAGFFEENAASFRVMEKAGMHLNGETDEEEYRGKKLKCIYCEICREDVME